MIDNVIICGLKRATNYVPELEVRQMLGRCGRSYDDSKEGNVFLMVKEEDEDMADKYLFGELPIVESRLSELEALAFHTLPQVFAREIYNQSSFYNWYSRSLSYLQGVKIDFKILYNYLLEMEMVVGSIEDFKITELGKVSCKFYYTPRKIFSWKIRFAELVSREQLNDDFSLAWALASEDLKMYFEDKEFLDFFKSSCSVSGFDLEDDLYDAIVYYCLITENRFSEIKFTMMEYRDDVDRLVNALLYLSRVYNWEIEEQLRILSIRIRKKVSYEVADFMFKSNIYNKSLIAHLMELGYNSLEDIKTNWDDFKRFADERMVRQLEEIMNPK